MWQWDENAVRCCTPAEAVRNCDDRNTNQHNRRALNLLPRDSSSSQGKFTANRASLHHKQHQRGSAQNFYLPHIEAKHVLYLLAKHETNKRNLLQQDLCCQCERSLSFHPVRYTFTKEGHLEYVHGTLVPNMTLEQCKKHSHAMESDRVPCGEASETSLCGWRFSSPREELVVESVQLRKKKP